jgi:hypothetical protein
MINLIVIWMVAVNQLKLVTKLIKNCMLNLIQISMLQNWEESIALEEPGGVLNEFYRWNVSYILCIPFWCEQIIS